VKKDCPSQRAYVATEDGGYISTSDIEEEDDDDVAANDAEDHVLGGGDTSGYMNIIVQRVLSMQIQQPERLQCHNLFHIFFFIKNHRARVIIDGGCCINLVSSDLVTKLCLTTRSHLHPYHIQWFNDSGKTKVQKFAESLFPLVPMLILLIMIWYLFKLVHFCWIALGNMIMMLHTMVGVINTLSCIKEKKLLWFL
jgi:hypothetical protein